MSFETIEKNGTRQIRPNFSEGELYSGSWDAPDSHPLSNVTLDGAQAIRSFFDAPFQATSTWRSWAHNIALGSNPTTTQHATGGAIDLQPTQDRDLYLQAFYNDMACKGPLYQELKAIGIKGIGIYNTFIHIDDGSNPASPRGAMAFWDNSDGRFGQVAITTAYMNTIPENGNPECNTEGQPEFTEQQVSEFEKKKTWIDRLFSVSKEDGIEGNRVQYLALASVSILLAFAVYGYMKRKGRI